MANTFKIVVVGPGQSGKTTWVKRLLTGQFENLYVPTLGVEVHPIRYNTNHGPICLNVWDCAGREQYRGLRDGYYIAADIAIVIYNQQDGVQKVEQCIKDLRHGNGNIPIVIVASHCDQKIDRIDQKLNNDYNNFIVPRFGELPFYQVSSLSNYNLSNTITTVLQILTKNKNLIIN